jgi:diguanylate cyclase (GGDEF)-like protein
MRPSVEDPAESLAKRIVEVVSAPITLSTGDKVSVGISVGIATYTDALDSMAALLAHADRALYEAKQKK